MLIDFHDWNSPSMEGITWDKLTEHGHGSHAAAMHWESIPEGREVRKVRLAGIVRRQT
jgi:hypothetical protein